MADVTERIRREAAARAAVEQDHLMAARLQADQMLAREARQAQVALGPLVQEGLNLHATLQGSLITQVGAIGIEIQTAALKQIEAQIAVGNTIAVWGRRVCIGIGILVIEGAVITGCLGGVLVYRYFLS